MKRSLISALASLLLTVDVRAAAPRWTVEFKEGAYTFLTATGLEVGQKTGPGAIAGYLVVKLPADVDPATTNRGVFLGRVRVPERRVTWLKGDEFAAGALLPAQHLIAVTPTAGFEPGLWAVKVRDTVKDRSGRPINPTNATWTVEIGEPRARRDDSGPARNTLKLKFTTEVDPATCADGIVVEKQVPGGWEEEPRGSATIAPREHGGLVNEIGLRPLGGWERGATYRVRVTEAIRDVRGLPLTNAEDFSFTVPKSGPFETRHEPRRPVAQANAQAAAAGPAFPGGQALGWHGHWTDPVTGLIYMRHRWYDPRTGTFLSPDPLEDIDSPNQYLFGAGRPHEVVDPLGLQSSPTGDARDQLRQAQAALQELTPDRPDIAPSRGEASIGRAFGRHAGEVGVVVGGMAATAAGEAIVFYTQEKVAELGFRVVIRIAGRSIQRFVRTLSEAERIAREEGAAKVRFESATGTKVATNAEGRRTWEYVVSPKGERGPGYRSAEVPEGMEKGHIRSIREGAGINPVDDSPLNIVGQTRTINRSNIARFEAWRAKNAAGKLVRQRELPGGMLRVQIPELGIDVTYDPSATIKWPDDWYLKGGTWR